MTTLEAAKENKQLKPNNIEHIHAGAFKLTFDEPIDECHEVADWIKFDNDRAFIREINRNNGIVWVLTERISTTSIEGIITNTGKS